MPGGRAQQIDPDGHYARLGVKLDASSGEIARAFRAQAKASHPDVDRAPGAPARFRALRASYELLSDPVRRATYDARFAHLLRRRRSGRPTLVPRGARAVAGLFSDGTDRAGACPPHPARACGCYAACQATVILAGILVDLRA